MSGDHHPGTGGCSLSDTKKNGVDLMRPDGLLFAIEQEIQSYMSKMAEAETDGEKATIRFRILSLASQRIQLIPLVRRIVPAQSNKRVSLQ